MGNNGTVFVLLAEQPSAKVVESGVPLKHDFPHATRIPARRFRKRLYFFIPRIAFGASMSAYVTREIRGQWIVHACGTYGLSNDEVGYVSRLPAL